MRLWTLGIPAILIVSSHAQTPMQPTAQSPIGTVPLADASVANTPGGIVSTSGGRATLTGSALVAAHERPANVALTRGGEVRVCQGTRAHLSESPNASLLIALDRGALEVRTEGRPGDVVLTPDLRFTLEQPGWLDLQMRVTPAGDTCVDNRGDKAPTLNLADTFGDTAYQLKPGQHVTFEHGSLHEVVDRENVPCGCPPDDLKTGSIADAIVSGGSKAQTPSEKAASAFPFPAAVSDGLIPPTPPAPGQSPIQISSTITFDPTAPRPTQTTQTPTPPPSDTPAKQPSHNPLAAIGRFFKRLFAR